MECPAARPQDNSHSSPLAHCSFAAFPLSHFASRAMSIPGTVWFRLIAKQNTPTALTDHAYSSLSAIRSGWEIPPTILKPPAFLTEKIHDYMILIFYKMRVTMSMFFYHTVICFLFPTCQLHGPYDVRKAEIIPRFHARQSPGRPMPSDNFLFWSGHSLCRTWRPQIC